MEEGVSARRRLALPLTLALLAPTLGAAGLDSKQEALWADLRERLAAVAARVDGVLAFSVEDLTSGATLELRQDEVFPTASTIKVAVLYELYRQAEEGRLRLDEVTRPGQPRVQGGGVLQVLGPRVSLTWRDLAVLMMGWSDNEATNLLIDELGPGAVDARLRGLGFAQTRLRRRMMDLEAARRGDENVSTAGELRRLARLLREAPGLAPERARDLLAVAAVEKSSPFREGLPAGLSFPVADKPGDLEGVRAACAYVALPGRPYAVGVMTGYLRRDADGEAAIREISTAVFETFDRLARSSPYGRIVSER